VLEIGASVDRLVGTFGAHRNASNWDRGLLSAVRAGCPPSRVSAQIPGGGSRFYAGKTECQQTPIDWSGSCSSVPRIFVGLRPSNILKGTGLPKRFHLACEGLVPALQRRGLMREACTQSTLRANLREF
jgi:hypothetical protein